VTAHAAALRDGGLVAFMGIRVRSLEHPAPCRSLEIGTLVGRGCRVTGQFTAGVSFAWSRTEPLQRGGPAVY
jgi:hypothetical protein